MRKFPFSPIIGLFIILSCLSATAQNRGREVTYPVSEFNFTYGNTDAGLPALTTLDSLQVVLDNDGGVFKASSDGSGETITLGSIRSDSVFSSSGLKEVLLAVVRSYNDLGFVSVFAVPVENQINARSGRDRRGDDTSLGIVIWVGVVDEVRTVAKGARFAEGETVNLTAHQRILDNSPLQPEDQSDGVFLIKPVIEEYLRRLNQHPGRRVDIALNSTGEAGSVSVDYLVTERKPWMAYTQFSNTGTDSTSEYRARIGAIHFQLFNADDVASIDYTTDAKDTNALFAYYERPLIYPNNLVGKVYANWDQFTARDFASFTSICTGK